MGPSPMTFLFVNGGRYLVTEIAATMGIHRHARKNMIGELEGSRDPLTIANWANVSAGALERLIHL